NIEEQIATNYLIRQEREMKKILLTMIGVTSLVLAADFSRDANGVVTDSRTGLEWQDDYSDNGGVIKTANRTEAIDYCDKLALSTSVNGWRLPDIYELTSLVDDTKSTPYIYSAFQEIGSAGDNYKYWSSTLNANPAISSKIKIYENNSTLDYDTNTTAWRVFFDTGTHWLGEIEIAGVNKVRCVRTAP
ncbi:MAG: DUF1566 domain-containing protein, partial [Thiovulaceae bacterium]|nr:DUF1566 domain-containing protein [Sulfurimonadaceae bacterium]